MQKAFNTFVEEKLSKIDDLSRSAIELLMMWKISR